jgi:uncharacterized protein YjbI with pentapeptide repeats
MRCPLSASIVLAVLAQGCGGDPSDDHGQRPQGDTVTRASFTTSVRRLQSLKLLDAGERTAPQRMPRFDDDPSANVGFFRTRLEGVDLSRLTLPRSFFGRSEVARVNFSGSDLSESNMCWNNFTDVSLSGALLAGADMRASIFVRVKFEMADLRGADLRHSTFTDCSFVGAKMEKVRLTNKAAQSLALDRQQRSAVQWETDEGPEPDGG